MTTPLHILKALAAQWDEQGEFSDPERENQEPWYGGFVAGCFEKILGAWRKRKPSGYLDASRLTAFTDTFRRCPTCNVAMGWSEQFPDYESCPKCGRLEPIEAISPGDVATSNTPEDAVLVAERAPGGDFAVPEQSGLGAGAATTPATEPLKVTAPQQTPDGSESESRGHLCSIGDAGARKAAGVYGVAARFERNGSMFLIVAEGDGDLEVIARAIYGPDFSLNPFWTQPVTVWRNRATPANSEDGQ